MTVNEQLMGLGSWTVTLREETPREVLDRLGYFGHIAIIPGRVNPAEYGDNLLDMAKYVGVLTKREFDDVKRISGQGMAVWLSDSDGKGDVFETPVTITGKTFAQAITQLMAGSTAVIVGTLYSVAGLYSGTHVWQSRGRAVDYVCSTMGAEWRVNGRATLDAGPIANLFKTTPDCVVVRRDAGRDLTLTGLTGDMELSRDVEDFTTRVVLLAEGEGEATATGSADIISNPYLDIRGNPVVRTRLISESETSTGNAEARAQLQLNRFTGTRNALRLAAKDIEIDGSFEVGDYVYVWDPDAGLYDTANEVTYRGQRINPIKLRAVEASWPVTEGMTVAYRYQDGSWIDLTAFFVAETGGTSIGVGELSRSLTSAGTEPVGPRPIPDSTIPGVITWDLPFESGVYIGPTGETRAKMLIKWELPLNEDGSTILDGDHYEIQYGLSPATDADWHTTYAPWGVLQAMVLDLTPGTDYDFRIRLVDSSNNQGDWSAVQTETANPDTIPPSTPAPPTVAGNRLSIQITHTLGKASGGTFNLEADLDHLEVHSGDTNSYTPDETTLKGKVAANAGMILAEIPAVGTVPCEEVTTRYVRVIAVDAAGNRSNPSATATVDALLVDDAHISDLTVTKVTAGTISANWLIGASIRTASSGQRVELNATGLHGYNGAGTELVSLLNTGAFTLRSAASGARVELDAANGFRAFNSGGTQTVALTTSGTFTLQTGTSGARLVLDGTGLKAYNSSSQATVDVSATTGTATFVGQISTAFSGKRIVFNPSGSALPEIRFTPASGTSTGRIVATVDTTSDYVGMTLESSTYSNGQATVQCWPNTLRLWHYPNVLGSANGFFAQSDGVKIHYNPGSGEKSITINGSGVDIFTAGGSFTVNGSTKTFVIDHPLDRDRWLVHATTESPHNGVEYWGTVVLDDFGVARVQLPAYFEALTSIEGRAVLLTALDNAILPPTASYPKDGVFEVRGEPRQAVSWLVKAIRRDVPALLVEPRRSEVTVRGDGPYRYYTPKESPHG